MALKGILLAICCSFVSLLIHLLISFFRKTRSETEPLICELMRQTRLLAAIWISTFLLYAALFFLPLEKINILINRLSGIMNVVGFAYGIIVYLFLSFVYLTIYYLTDRSVSATILEIIDSAAQKKLTADEIKNIYDVEKKYQTELKGMLEGRFIIEESDYYRNSLKGRMYASVVRTMKRILRLGPGG